MTTLADTVGSIAETYLNGNTRTAIAALRRAPDPATIAVLVYRHLEGRAGHTHALGFALSLRAASPDVSGGPAWATGVALYSAFPGRERDLSDTRKDASRAVLKPREEDAP